MYKIYDEFMAYDWVGALAEYCGTPDPKHTLGDITPMLRLLMSKA